MLSFILSFLFVNNERDHEGKQVKINFRSEEYYKSLTQKFETTSLNIAHTTGDPSINTYE